MKPTKIYVEAKVSRNFQTYTVGVEAELDEIEGIQLEANIRLLQTRVRKMAKEQVAIDAPTHEVLK